MAITNNTLSKRQRLEGRYDRALKESQSAQKGTARFAEASKQLQGIRRGIEGLPADTKPSPSTRIKPSITQTSQGQTGQINNQTGVQPTGQGTGGQVATNGSQLTEVQLAQQNYAKSLGDTDQQMQLKQSLLNEMLGNAQGDTTEKRLQLEQQLGLGEAMKTRDLYSGEVSKIGDELIDVRNSIKEEGGALTKAFAGRLEAEKSMPLREQLIQLSKGQALEEQKIQSIESEIGLRMQEQRQDSANRIQMLEKSIDLMAVPDSQKALAKMQLEDAKTREARRLDMQEYTVKQQVSRQIDLEYERAKRVLDLELAGAETAVKVEQTAQIEAAKALMKYGDIKSNDPLLQRQAVIKTVEDIMESVLYKDVPLKRGVVGVATAIQQRLLNGDDLTTAVEEELIKGLELKEEVKERREEFALKERMNEELLKKTEASIANTEANTARTQGLTNKSAGGSGGGTSYTNKQGYVQDTEGNVYRFDSKGNPVQVQGESIIDNTNIPIVEGGKETYGPPVPSGFGEDTTTTKSSLDLLMEKYK